MAQQAQADGIAAFCATPHTRHDHGVRIAELASRLAELSAAVRRAGCDIRILPEGEVAVSAHERLDDDELAMVALGGSARWILLEPAPGPLDDRLEMAVLELRSRGFRALVAHPERHLAPDLAHRLSRLIAGGALVQATAAFFTDEVTRSGMLALARAGVIHVLGSDSHSSRAGRPVALAAGLKVLGSVEPTAAHFQWTARAAPDEIVNGRELSAPFQPSA
jgi:protein-tyrosine phosphatase